jgi:hypothetical protein
MFIDALRPNLLNVYDSSMPETILNKTFKKLGGTIFTNCYTSSPDTTRSIASLWSSKYPKSNECNTRMKWAKYCMNQPEASLLFLLKQNGYSFNIFTGGRNFTESGLPPPFFDEEFGKSIGMTLSDWASHLKNEKQPDENSITFICLPDFHMRLDVIGYNKKNALKTFNLVNDLVETVDNMLDIHSFDSAIIFSDHGCLIKEDGKLCKSNLLIEGRVQTYLQVINKAKNNDNESYSIDSKLRSIMDIYPTVLELAGISYPEDIAGKNLFAHTGHEYILLEDHTDFSIGVGISPKIWGAVDTEGIHVIDYDGIWKSVSKDKEKLSFYKKELEEKMSFFAEYQKQFYVIGQYNKLKIAMRTLNYSNGERQKVFLFNIMIKLKRLIKNIMPLFLVKKLGMSI